MRFNKDKPSINEKSENLLYESNNWKPLHLRTGEVIQKANQQLEKLKERVNEERMKKELEQQKIIEQNRVDRHTKGKKVKAEDWEELYNQRFKKYLEVKNKKLEYLNEKWNQPNQAVPLINKARNELKTQRNESLEDVGDRLYNFADFKMEKIKKLERDLTPKFKPHINKNTDKIIKNSAQKSRNAQIVMKQYNSMNTVTDFVKGSVSNNDFIVSNFNNDYNKSTSNLASKITEDFYTKTQTDGSISTGTYNTKANERPEDFKTFLDSYEQNITKAILIDEMQENASSYNSSNYNLFVNTFNDNERAYLNRDINYGKQNKF